MTQPARCWIYLTASAALLLGASSAGAQDTSWVYAGPDAGDWFDPLNWSDGVPQTSAFPWRAGIDNAGAARIQGGDATAAALYVAETNAGKLVVSGGRLAVSDSIELGSARQSSGHLLVTGGEVQTRWAIIGGGLGAGRFDHSGGSVAFSTFTIGNAGFSPALAASDRFPEDYGRGLYNLSGGQANATQMNVGYRGLRIVNQQGGRLEVAENLNVGGRIAELPDYSGAGMTEFASLATSTAHLVVIPSGFETLYPSRGNYTLSGGELVARRLTINPTGSFQQTGGKLAADVLEILPDSQFTFAGGRIDVNAGLMPLDNFDFEGSSAQLVGHSAILDFSKGIRNAQQARISAGVDSLTMFPAGFSPTEDLGSFSSQGLVHFAGDDLAVASGRRIHGVGLIDDHVILRGAIDAYDTGGVSLGKGIELFAGASAQLGSGALTVVGDRSAIRGGTLAAQSINVGSSGILVPWIHAVPAPPTPIFPADRNEVGELRQTAGSVSAQSLSITNGRYEISNGELNADSIWINGNSFTLGAASNQQAVMTQRGGVVNAYNLSFNPVFFYLQSSATDLRAIYSAGNLETNSDGVVTTFSIVKPRYEMHGGALNLVDMNLADGLGGVGADFIQTGGDVAVSDCLQLYSGRTQYVMSGGSLSARRIQIGNDIHYGQQSGAFAIVNQNARVTVAGDLRFGEGAKFIAVPGAEIHFTQPGPAPFPEWPAINGNALSIFDSNSDALGGLSNLKVIFEGGSDLIATIEAAGADRGPTLAGFYQNFAIDTLVIGGVEPASLSLVDLFQNHEGGSLPNALYVEHLVINAGSTLDLNGLNLYYRTASIASSSLLAGSSFGIQVIPEPAAATLALVAAPLFIRRRAS